MRYGMTFDIEMFDFERSEEMRVLAMPGDCIRMNDWFNGNYEPSGIELSDDLRRNYALAWFAMSRRGLVAELGLPEEPSVEAFDAMADRFSIYVADFTDDKRPTAAGAR